MPYCTLSDIEGALPREDIVALTDDQNFDRLDETVVNKAITGADSEIDGYLRGRYELPLSSAPELIKDISIEITIYKLFKRRRKIDMPESILNDYKLAVKKLESISKGTISLGVEATNEPSGGEFATNKDSSSRVFTKELLDTY